MPQGTEKSSSLFSKLSATPHFIALLFAAVFVLLNRYCETHFAQYGQYCDLTYLSLMAILLVEAVLVMRTAFRIQEIQSTFGDLVRVDPLTGCFTRGALVELVEREVARAGRMGKPLAILMIDIPHFSVTSSGNAINSNDLAIIELARTILKNTRETDLLGHLEPGELALILPDTPTDHVSTVVDKLRNRFEQTTDGTQGQPGFRTATATPAQDGKGVIWRFEDTPEKALPNVVPNVPGVL